MAQVNGADNTRSAIEAAMTIFADMKKLESVKLARLSSFYKANTTYLVLLVREMGTFDARRKLGKNIRPGYLIVKKKSWVEKHLSQLQFKEVDSERDNFEKLVKYIFGEDLHTLNAMGAYITGTEVSVTNNRSDPEILTSSDHKAFLQRAESPLFEESSLQRYIENSFKAMR